MLPTQLFPLERAHMRDDQFQIGIAFHYLHNAPYRRQIIICIWIGMNGHGDPAFLRKCEDSAVVIRIKRQSGIVRVKLDAVQRVIGKGAAKCID